MRNASGLRPVGRMERMRYLRRLPLRRRVWLFAAVACTFGAVGFVIDLMGLPALRAPWAGVVTAVVYGLIACGYLAAAISGTRWIPLAILGQFGMTLALERLLPKAVVPGLAAPMVQAIARHAVFAGFGCMAAIIAGYVLFIGFITRQGLRQVRLDTEIALARDIHASLVPPIARRFDRLEVVGRSVPSSEVGGDLLDVLDDHGRVLALVADVSGHGVQAGTLMAMIRSAVRVRTASPCTLDELFADLDRLLIDLGRPDKFVTAACLRFDPAGEVEALLAGHLPVVVVRAGAHAVERIEGRRPPIGIPAPMTVSATRYATGDLFAFLTDGLTEVEDRTGRSLDLEAIEAMLCERPAAPLAEIADAVFERAQRHGAITDDQTLLLVRGL